MNKNLLKYGGKLRNAIANTGAKIGTGLTALAVSGQVLAGGGSSPGAAIAGELSGGEADMILIFSAVAVFIGLLLVWAYTKRAANK